MAATGEAMRKDFTYWSWGWVKGGFAIGISIVNKVWHISLGFIWIGGEF